jgi:hypothetical protein
VGIHRQHDMRQQTVRAALVQWSQAAPGLAALGALALAGRGKADRCGVLYRQHMPPRYRRAGLSAPAGNDLRRRHLRIGKEPAGPQLTAPVAAKPAKADRLAQHHAFDNRSPPLSRRASPNCPSDQFIAAGSLFDYAARQRIAVSPSRASEFCRQSASTMRCANPIARRADWYARRVGVAAARKINTIPAARHSMEESMPRAAGVKVDLTVRSPPWWVSFKLFGPFAASRCVRANQGDCEVDFHNLAFELCSGFMYVTAWGCPTPWPALPLRRGNARPLRSRRGSWIGRAAGIPYARDSRSTCR